MEEKKYTHLRPRTVTEEPTEATVDPTALCGAEPEVLANAIVSYLDAKKGMDLLCLDVAEKTSLTSDFVIATATSTTHAKALGDEVDFQTSRRGFAPISTEGRAGGAWVLIDYGPVIVHVFTRDARDFYRIERLYTDET